MGQKVRKIRNKLQYFLWRETYRLRQKVFACKIKTITWCLDVEVWIIKMAASRQNTKLILWNLWILIMTLFGFGQVSWPWRARKWKETTLRSNKEQILFSITTPFKDALPEFNQTPLSLSLSLSFCIFPKVTPLSLRNPHGVSPQKAVFRFGQHNGGVPVVLWFWVERLRFLSIVMLFRLSFGLPLLHFYSLSPKKSWKALPLLGHLSLRARHHFLCCLPLCFLQEVLFTAAPF